MAAETPKSDLLQGTLDMLILKVVALGPIHGYAIAQRLQQMSRDVLQVQQGSLYPALDPLFHTICSDAGGSDPRTTYIIGQYSTLAHLSVDRDPGRCNGI